MLRRHDNVPPVFRLLQASVLVAFAIGVMLLALYADGASPRVATERHQLHCRRCTLRPHSAVQEITHAPGYRAVARLPGRR